MRRLIFLILLLPFFASAQAPTSDSTKLTVPPVISSFTPNSWYQRGGNASNAQIGFLNTITGDWVQLLTGYQFNHYTGTSTQAQINTKINLDSLGYVSVNIASTGKIKTFIPTANTDAARGIALQNAFTFSSTGDAITIGAGSYFVTTALSVKDGQSIVLNGTIYHTNNAINVFYLNNVHNATIKGNGTITGSGVPNGTTQSEIGINIEGNSDNIKIEGLTINNFRGRAIYANNIWSDSTQYFSGSIITNCALKYNRIGVDFVAEYWKISGSTIRYNTIGINDPAGNLNITGSSISENDYGIYMDGSLLGNEGHGAVTGNQITHNRISAIYVKNVTIGEQITGNIIAGVYPYATTDTTIYIKSSRGVNFTGGSMLAPMNIYVDGTFTGYNYIRDIFFYGAAPTLHGTSTQKQHLLFQQNNSMDSLSTYLDSGVYNSQRLNMYQLDRSTVYNSGVDNFFMRKTADGVMRIVTPVTAKAAIGLGSDINDISVPGAITSTAGNNIGIFFSGSATTGFQDIRLKNTSGDMVIGIEGSSATINAGAKGYATSLTTATKTELSLGTNQHQALHIDTNQNTIISNSLILSPLTTAGVLINNTSGTVSSTPTLADSYISSASTWFAKQSAITFGTGVQSALGNNIGSAGSPILYNGASGTPSSMTGTNITGTAIGLTVGSAATLTTSRNIQGVAFNGSVDINPINGTGFVKSSGPTLSYDNSTYYKSADNPSFGTIDASGLITSTMGNNTNIFYNGSATTGYQFMRLKNTGGDMLLGIEGSSASINAGAAPYATSLSTANNTHLSLGTNQAQAIDIDGSQNVAIPKLTTTTQSAGDNSTKAANTAFVAAAVSAGLGLFTPRIVGRGEITNATNAQSSVATYTVGAGDESFDISANVVVTTSTVHNFSITCAYTDQSNTARVVTLNTSQLTGAFITAITNVTGASAYEGVPIHIRAKAGTAVTIATTGTFTTVTYSIEGLIERVY